MSQRVMLRNKKNMMIQANGGRMFQNWPTNDAVITKISDEQILVKRYSPNGELRFMGHYKMTDEFRERLNGEEITLENYETRDGSKNGLASWYFNGQVRLQRNYKNGHPYGTVTRWYENGQIKSEENYQNEGT